MPWRNDGTDFFDPIAMDGSGGAGDPLAMQPGMPDAQGPIGAGITAPPPGAAQQPMALGSLDTPVSGLPPMPMIAPPTTSQKLIAAGLAMIAADRAHLGLGGSLAAGMGAYNDVLTNSKNEAAKQRLQQLSEYELMSRIQDRHQTELAMQKKLEAGARIKTAYPELADLYDADPEAAIKIISAKADPKTKFENVGGTLYKMEEGKDPIPYGPNGQPLGKTDPNTPDNSGLTGQDFLDSLKDQAHAARIKALAQGQYSLNKRAKTYNQDMQDVLQYDPEATEINLNARQATRKAFTSGQPATAVTQLNTALGHAAKLMSLVDALHNVDGIPGATYWNAAKNAYRSSGGKDTALKDYNSVLQNFVDESAKVYNPGGGTEPERKARMESLAASGGPDQIKSALTQQIGLMTSKLDALDQQYKNGMGTMAKKYEFLSPEARKTLMDAGMLDPSEAQDKALQPSNVVPASMVPPQPAPTTQLPPPPAAAAPDVGGGILGPPAPALTQEQQLAYTAKKHGMTVEQVKKKLGIK